MQFGTSLVVQWLRPCTSTAAGTGVIPDQGTKIPNTMLHRPKKEKKLSVQFSGVLYIQSYVTITTILETFHYLERTPSPINSHRPPTTLAPDNLIYFYLFLILLIYFWLC